MPVSLFQIGANLFSMGLIGLIIYYLKHLETIGCKCAMNYKRTYIMSYQIFALAFGVGTLLSGNKMVEYIVETSYAVPFLILLAVAAITNIVFTLMYVEELKKENCDCSESVFRTMMYIISIIQAATLGLTILFGIIVGGLFMSIKSIAMPLIARNISLKGKRK